MVLKCLHYDNKTEKCGSQWQSCAKSFDCPGDNNHCYAVYETNETNVMKAGCNEAYSHELCGSQCTGKLRGRVHYCCCSENDCNKRFFLPVLDPQTLPSTPPSQLAPQINTATNESPWLLIVVIFLLIGLIVGTFVKRKSIKRAVGLTHHVEADNANGQARNHTNGGKINNNNNHTIINNIGDNNNHASELNELNFIREVNIPIHASTSTNVTTVELNSTSLNDAGGAIKITQTAPTQPYFSKLDLNNIKLLEVVGSGRFGTVHRACIDRTRGHNTDRKEGTDNHDKSQENNLSNDNENTTTNTKGDEINYLAVKVIHASEHQSWQNELKIYSLPKTKHPNILTFFGSCQLVESENYWLLVEFAPRGSLHEYLKANTVSWKELLDISSGIVNGLAQLHDADVAHRDFKSKNVLLKHDLTPCIADFGVASMLDNPCGSQTEQRKKFLQVGTPRYMAPEVLECSVTFTKTSFTKIDVYALSLVLWELLNRCWPLPKLEHYDGDDSLMGPNYFPIQSAHHHHHHHHHHAQTVFPNQDDDMNDEQTNLLTGNNDNQVPSAYTLPFENAVGSNPDINTMRQIVICEKLRPPIKYEWYYFPISKLCKAIIDGWEYDHDARISASCFVERIEGLQQQQLQSRLQLEQQQQQELPSHAPVPPLFDQPQTPA